jgi:hypothetical protein
MAASRTRGANGENRAHPVPLTRWQDWVAAAAVTVVAAGLVIADILDTGFRHWWAAHALTTSTVTGLLVLLITFEVADQVVRMRQRRDRSRAVAAQAAILLAQAARTSHAVSAALDGSGERDAASDELRTYMMMLLVGAPVLIDDRLSRRFLEQAQHLAAELGRSEFRPGLRAGPLIPAAAGAYHRSAGCRSRRPFHVIVLPRARPASPGSLSGSLD